MRGRRTGFIVSDLTPPLYGCGYGHGCGTGTVTVTVTVKVAHTDVIKVG
jgi:hypothetical protein